MRRINDPNRPENHFSFDQVWHSYGYIKQPEMKVHYKWRDVGEKIVTQKTLVYYIKKLA